MGVRLKLVDGCLCSHLWMSTFKCWASLLQTGGSWQTHPMMKLSNYMCGENKQVKKVVWWCKQGILWNTTTYSQNIEKKFSIFGWHILHQNLNSEKSQGLYMGKSLGQGHHQYHPMWLLLVMPLTYPPLRCLLVYLTSGQDLGDHFISGFIMMFDKRENVKGCTWWNDFLLAILCVLISVLYMHFTLIVSF